MQTMEGQFDACTEQLFEVRQGALNYMEYTLSQAANMVCG